MRIALAGHVGLSIAVVFLWSCGDADTAAVEVPTPSLAGMEAPVRSKIEGARDALQGNLRSATSWGYLGAVLDAHGLERRDRHPA